MNRPWRIGENMPRREDIPLLRGEVEFFATRRSMAQVRWTPKTGQVAKREFRL